MVFCPGGQHSLTCSLVLMTGVGHLTWAFQWMWCISTSRRPLTESLIGVFCISWNTWGSGGDYWSGSDLFCRIGHFVYELVVICLRPRKLLRVVSHKARFWAHFFLFYIQPIYLHQLDLDNLSSWCQRWMMPLNLSKCCVMHIAKNNPRAPYYIDGVRLGTVTRHLDLGVTIAEDLSWSDHIASVSTKARQMIYLFSKAFPNTDVVSWGMIYKSYIRPIMEYAGPAWWTSLRGEVDGLESVQRWCTRIPYGVRRPDYATRLRVLDMPTFEQRRARGDLMFSYRAVHGHFGPDIMNMYRMNTNNLRGHGFKLAKEKFRTTQRQMFLSNRVFNVWNSLPETVVESSSVNGFKNSFDRWVTSSR
ncbi:uncharacterized protein LOC123310477 isoform X2 [Coccinella septempunctata]|uniref:uncharacterized protein LOC123310477 isoform X1 n=1 Tax=Coccinella septempunctata TaxID=41139 RepID=UPI001D0963F6|nr:uncharacterized protein LOC123310477 isoform X1 [Coccinella septempunctata]XP_044749884.1 uncharacterized protein LOC123310477 isoform X2 [Coccinella septempunctata]